MTQRPRPNTQDDSEAIADHARPAGRFAGPVAVVLVLLIALAPLLYVLALGPLVWLDRREIVHFGNDSYVVAFYTPLMKLCEHSETLTSLVNSYIALWELPPPPRFSSPLDPATYPVPASPPNTIPPVTTPQPSSGP